MTTLLLVRHAENDFVRQGKLAGWTPGVHLNERGSRQAQLLGARLCRVRVKAIYSSPLERAVETAEAIASCHPNLSINVDERLGEAHYGGWTGKSIRQLSRTQLWQIVQRRPSQARFPQGESIREMQARAVLAIEEIVAARPKGVVIAVSHGDIIKAVVAHYAGMHLDLFQRLLIAPASISAIDIGPAGATIQKINDTCHAENVKEE